MLPCAFLNVFATGSSTSSDVIFSATFGENGDGAAKIENAKTNGAPTVSAETGYLNTGGSAWHYLEMVTDDVMSSYDTYSIQITFRWNGHDQNENCGIYFGSYFCDYSIQYNGNVQNFATGEDKTVPKYNNSLGQELKAMWAIPDGETSSPWITATLEIKENAPKAFIINVGEQTKTLEYTGSVTNVKTTKKDGGTTDPQFGAIYTGGNMSYHEIKDFRVIDGVTEAVSAPEAPENAGEILYSMTFNGSDESKQRAKDWVGPYKTSVQSDGLLLIEPMAKWNKWELSKDVLKGQKTYTVQLTFRYLSNTKEDGGIALGISNANDTNVGWRYSNFNNKGDTYLTWYGSKNPGTVIDKTFAEEWKAPEDALAAYTGMPSTAGHWITATMEIVDGALGNFHFECNGIERHFENPCEKSATGDMSEGKLFMYFSNAGIEIYDYRVVAGVEVDLQTPAIPDLPFTGVNLAVDNKVENKAEENASEKEDTTETASSEDTDEENKAGGCGSFVTTAMIPVFGITFFCGAVIAKRKRND